MHKMLLLLPILLGTLACSGQPSTPPSQKSSPELADPWPECKPIRDWLRIHAHDPSSVEVVEWMSRYHRDDAEPNVVFVGVRIRGKNRLGALSNFADTFRVIDRREAESLVRNHKDTCHD